jgi:GAF domain-containing protein
VENQLAWHAIQSAQAVAGQPYTHPATQRRLVELCAPLSIRSTPFGALTLTTPAESASEHQLQLLSGLADYAAIGLEQARILAALASR